MTEDISKNKVSKESQSVRNQSDGKFLVVGLGASAGGIQALREFFKNSSSRFSFHEGADWAKLRLSGFGRMVADGNSGDKLKMLASKKSITLAVEVDVEKKTRCNLSQLKAASGTNLRFQIQEVLCRKDLPC